MALQDVIAKIQKLRNLAGNNTSLEEATTAAALADKLIAEHRLSEADVSVKSDDISFAEAMEDEGILYETGKITQWRSNLAIKLASHYGCAMFNDTIFPKNEETFKRRQVSRYRLVGQKSDIEIIHYMFAWLSGEIERLSDKEAKGKAGSRGAGRVFCACYCLGAVAGVSEQLDRNKKAQAVQALTDGKSAALVKLDEREQQANEFLNKMHNLKKSKRSYSHTSFNSEAYHAGKEQGGKIDLNASTRILNK